jgi:uncharacterized repeat protein (TIGR02543 family)
MFDSNGGSEVAPISEIPYKVLTGEKDINGKPIYTEKTVTLPSPARTGYTFNGWKLSGSGALFNGTVKSSMLGVDTDGKNITLKAQWTENTSTVWFDTAGGVLEEPWSKEVTYGSPYGELPVPTWTGLTFLYWFDQDGNIVTEDTVVSRDYEHVIKAAWQPNTYKVWYDTAGGVLEEPWYKEVTYGSTYGKLRVPTWAGLTFLYWFDQDGNIVTEDTVVSHAYEHIIKAAWQPNTYTVTFNANGGSVSPTEKTVTYGSPYGELPVPTRHMHDFNGWYTDSTDGTIVTESIINAIPSNQVIYARWTPKMCKVIFYGLNGSVLLAMDVAYGTWIKTPSSVPNVPAEKFFGWTWGPNDSVRYQPGDDMQVDKLEEKLYPVADTKTTITAEVNPLGAGSIVYVNGHVDQTGDAGRLVKIAVSLENEAYYFSGWSNGSTSLTNEIDVITNMHLIANFTMKTNLVEFIGWDGESIGLQSVPYGGSATNMVPPVYEGLTFAAWASDSFMNNVTTGMTIRALYETNRYTVVYNANGGYGSMSNDVFMYFAEYSLHSNTFWHTASEFLGWASNPNATTNEVEYADGAIVSNLTAVANGTNVLYAVWHSLLSEYSIAADCTNLVLECAREDRKWSIDADSGFASTSSVMAAGYSVCDMTALIEGAGTLTFRLKILTASTDNSEFNLHIGDILSAAIPEIKAVYYYKELNGDWLLCSFRKSDPLLQKFIWNYSGKSDEDRVYVDQVRWYPNRLVSVDTSGESWVESGHEANGIAESLLTRWDDIFPDGITEVQIDATKPTGAESLNSPVTNALSILNLGYSPEYTVNGSTAKLTFTDAPVLAINAFEVEGSTVASLGASVTNTSWGLPDYLSGVDKALAVWGAPTLTSSWSRVEAECDLSRYVSEGIALFNFDAGTNRFFKVKAD